MDFEPTMQALVIPPRGLAVTTQIDLLLKQLEALALLVQLLLKLNTQAPLGHQSNSYSQAVNANVGLAGTVVRNPETGRIDAWTLGFNDCRFCLQPGHH